jgi:hypothetical protein
MGTLADFLDPNNPFGDRYGEYAILFQEAYDQEPTTTRFLDFLDMTPAEQQTAISSLTETLTSAVMIRLTGLTSDVPEWMMAGAPDSDTYQRWLRADLIR